MPLSILNISKKLAHTNRIDPDPYFNRWEAVLPLGSKDQPELVGQPCYKHKTCGHLVASPHTRVPPKVCHWCHVDVVCEAEEVEILEKNGVHIIEAPKTIVSLKISSFASAIRHFRSS